VPSYYAWLVASLDVHLKGLIFLAVLHVRAFPKSADLPMFPRSCRLRQRRKDKGTAGLSPRPLQLCTYGQRRTIARSRGSAPLRCAPGTAQLPLNVMDITRLWKSPVLRVG